MVAAYLSPDEILVYNKELDNYRCIVMGLFLHYFFMAQFSWMMTQVEYFILVKIGHNVMEPVTYWNIRRTRELFLGRKKRIPNSWAGECGVGIMTSHGSYSKLVRVFSDVLVAFLYFDICHYLVANIKIWKSHLNIREGSD